MNKYFEYAQLKGTEITKELKRKYEADPDAARAIRSLYQHQMFHLGYLRHHFIKEITPLDEERKRLQQKGKHFWDDVER
jgi:hypothetical protein